MLRVRRLSWISIAQRTASTALENSASTASPAVLKMRPPDEIVHHRAVGRKTPQRLFLVLGDEAAIARNIGDGSSVSWCACRIRRAHNASAVRRATGLPRHSKRQVY